MLMLYIKRFNMCMKREDDDIDKSGYPFPIMDFIDLTLEEFGNEDVIEMTPRNDQLNYPYNLLPSSDEDEPTIFMLENNDGNFVEIPPNTRHHRTNEIVILSDDDDDDENFVGAESSTVFRRSTNDVNQRIDTSSVSTNFNFTRNLNEDSDSNFVDFELNAVHDLLNEENQHINTPSTSANSIFTRITNESRDGNFVDPEFNTVHSPINEINQNINMSNETVNVNLTRISFEDRNENYDDTELNIIHSPSNEVDQNVNVSTSASVNINFNITDHNDSDQPIEVREFELNIPQILLFMSRISNNLYERAATFHD